MNTPDATVVIPCHNHFHYLGECLESVLGQTIRNWEAIVVDDASETIDDGLVRRLSGDPRITFIRHEHNRGLGAARNSGFRLASAPFVVPLDADDMLAPAYLETLVERLTREPEADCAFPDFRYFGAFSGVLRRQLRDIGSLLYEQWIPGPGTLMRRVLWERVGGYSEAQELRLGNEDWDFWLRAAGVGLRPVHVREPLYHYRVQGSSMVTRLAYDEYSTREYIYRQHRHLFDRYQVGRRFLAGGYRNAAAASWQRGERFRTLRLAFRGLVLDPLRIDLLRLCMASVTPGPVWRAVQAMKRRRQDSAQS